jgi:hypothetical protein
LRIWISGYVPIQDDVRLWGRFMRHSMPQPQY